MIERIKIIFVQKWVTLRKIGEARFVNSMYIWIFIVPVVAKSFEYVDEHILKLVIFQQKIPFSTTLPFSWKVFYFSALSFALGNLIVKVRCPKIIKEHLSLQSYKNEGKTLKQLEPYSNDIAFDWGKLANEVDKRITNLQMQKDEGNGGVVDNYPNLSTEDPVHYFWPIFEEANQKYVFSRTACTLLYCMGFSLFSWVIIQNTVVVIGFITK